MELERALRVTEAGQQADVAILDLARARARRAERPRRAVRVARWLAPVAAAVALTPDGALSVTQAFLAVAYGASCVFLLPYGNQVNLMVMGPGGYEAKDFLKAGAPMAVIMAVSCVLLLTLM